jgi:hypothetical protein
LELEMPKMIPGPFRIGITLTKLLLYVVIVVVFVGAIYAIMQRKEAELVTEFQALKQVDPLPKARKLAAEGQYCEALEYLGHFLEYDYVRRDPAAIMLYNEIEAKRDSYLFRGKDIISGLWSGKGACPEALISATVSDFLVIGDVRDLVWGTINKIRGQEADNFTMALAGVGVVLTGATLVATPATAGGAAPAGVSAKVTLSLLKLAKRLGKLPKSLQKALVRIFKVSIKTKSIKALKPISRSVYKVAYTRGIKIPDFLAMVSKSKKISDLKFMEKVASTYGKYTGKFLKLAGDTPVEVVRKFGKSRYAVRAVNTSIQYGPEGSKLLMKTGPRKFLKYVTAVKFSARTTRVIWKQRIDKALVKLMKFLPESYVIIIAILTGLGAIGFPANGVRKIVKRRRQKQVMRA